MVFNWKTICPKKIKIFLAYKNSNSSMISKLCQNKQSKMGVS